MMKSSEYWKQRFQQLEDASHAYGQKTYAEIEPAFTTAQRNIQKEIEAWYGRFADNNGITLQEARKMLSSKDLKELQWDINDYIKYGKENAIDGRWMKELENASAKFHISRLEALQLRTQQAMEAAFGNELDAVDGMARHLYSDGYYHSIFEVQKGFNVGWNVGQIDNRTLDNVITKPWSADGKTFSDRIWSRKTQTINELHQELTRTLIQGKAPDAAIKHITQFVDGKVKNAKYAASRLVMTEDAYFHSISQQQAFKDLDVEEYEIVATLDSRTSEICQEMDGQHFPMKDYDPGSTAPPFHPNCRSVTVPYFDDEWSGGERAARDEDGKTYYVPSDMTYPEWKKSFVDGDPADTAQLVKPKDKPKTMFIDKISDSGDMSEAMKQAHDVLGIDYIDCDKMNVSVANMMNHEIARIYDTFGNLHEAGVLDEIRNYPKRTSWYAAYSNPWKSVFVKNVNAKSAMKKLADDAKANFDIGFWSSSDTEHTIRHEVGHAVQHWLTDSAVSGDYKAKKLEDIHKIREQTLSDLGITNWSTKDTPEHIKAAGKKLSYYGLRNDAEFIAESVAQYMSGSPGDIAKQVVEILLRGAK